MTDRGERRTFEAPVVPLSLQRKTIGTMPLVSPFWVSVDMDDTAEALNFGNPLFVEENTQRLMARKSTELGPDEQRPESITNCIGIMAVMADASGGGAKKFLLADLRYVEADTLPVEDNSEVPDDQEEADYYFADQEDIVPVDAFIACDLTDEDNVDPSQYDYFGPVVLHSFLDQLARMSDDMASLINEEADEDSEDEDEGEIDETPKDSSKRMVKQASER
jgi:hypothetical protein